jgi:hypothetical protein
MAVHGMALLPHRFAFFDCKRMYWLLRRISVLVVLLTTP